MPPQLQGATTGLFLGGKHVKDEACHHPQFGGTTVTPLTVVFLLWGVAGGVSPSPPAVWNRRSKHNAGSSWSCPKSPRGKQAWPARCDQSGLGTLSCYLERRNTPLFWGVLGFGDTLPHGFVRADGFWQWVPPEAWPGVGVEVRPERVWGEMRC